MPLSLVFQPDEGNLPLPSIGQRFAPPYAQMP